MNIILGIQQRIDYFTEKQIKKHTEKVCVPERRNRQRKRAQNKQKKKLHIPI